MAINDIPGRKASIRDQLKGDTLQDRVRNLCDHFSNLLGKPSDKEEANEEIEPILEDLDIKIGPLIQEEYRRQNHHW